MPKKSKKSKKSKNSLIDHRIADPAEQRADHRALEGPGAADEPPMTSPNKLMALLFGIPLAVLFAAVAFRALS